MTQSDNLKRILDRLVWGDEPGDKELVAWASAEILKLVEKEFRAGQLDCQKNGRIDNHAAYPKAINEARVEELEVAKMAISSMQPDPDYYAQYIRGRIKELKEEK